MRSPQNVIKTLRPRSAMGALAMLTLAVVTGANGADSGKGSTQVPVQAPGVAAAASIGDIRLEAAAPANGRPTLSVMLAAASAGKRIVVAGERGTIVVSDDCGARWTQAKVPVGVTLTALGFADDQHGWALGHGGVVLASGDAGATWSKR